MVNIYTHPPDCQCLQPESSFRFHCHPGLACFNLCCQQPTIIIKPYDILRLRRRLGITSTAFLARYTVRLMEEASLLPLRLLALQDEDPGGCPFVDTATGCTVYDDRPAACRLFPVIQGSSLNDGQAREVYFLKKLDFCQGFLDGPTWTLAQWRADQELAIYEELNQEWVDILLHQGARLSAGGTGPKVQPFELAVYDLDAFRRFVLETAFAAKYALSPPLRALLRQDDTALLRLGYAYARLVLGLADAPALQATLENLAALAPGS